MLVVGPSGAGKDTLINAARKGEAVVVSKLGARRVITRDAVLDVEDHDTLDPDQFDLRRRCGGFALDWEAHGLRYAVPASIDAAMMVGRVAVANVSRAVIAQATEKYPQCHVLLITATPEARAERLAQRGRESEAEIAARLAREGAALPTGVPVFVLAQQYGVFVNRSNAAIVISTVLSLATLTALLIAFKV